LRLIPTLNEALTPAFAIVVMAYIIGALGGSIPLPASIGTIGGIAGMLIVYGVHHNPAVAAVLLHPPSDRSARAARRGRTIGYIIIRRKLGPIPIHDHDGSV
jgi:hypothetical protein